MVCFGFASAQGVRSVTLRFSGDREAVRLQSVAFVLRTLRDMLGERTP
jgi:nicotinamide mononucleotide (NMN) deamidase PncC